MFKAEFTCVFKEFCRGPQVKARWKGRFFFQVIFPGNILMNFIQDPVKIEHSVKVWLWEALLVPRQEQGFHSLLALHLSLKLISVQERADSFCLII